MIGQGDNRTRKGDARVWWLVEKSSTRVKGGRASLNTLLSCRNDVICEEQNAVWGSVIR